MSLRDARTGRTTRQKPARRTPAPRPRGTRRDERGLMEELLDEWAADMSGDYDIFAG